METIDNNYGKLAFKYIIIINWHNNINTCSGGGGSGSKHATFIIYRLNQIIKSKCVSDGSEMKIMIKGSHSHIVNGITFEAI